MKRLYSLLWFVIPASFLFSGSVSLAQGDTYGLSADDFALFAAANTGGGLLPADFSGSFSIDMPGDDRDIDATLRGSGRLHLENGTLSAEVRVVGEYTVGGTSTPIDMQVTLDGSSVSNLSSQLTALLDDLTGISSPTVNPQDVIRVGLSTLVAVVVLDDSLGTLPQPITMTRSEDGGFFQFSARLSVANLISAALTQFFIDNLPDDGTPPDENELAALNAMALAIVAEGTTGFDVTVNPIDSVIRRLALDLNLPFFEINANTPPISIALNFTLNFGLPRGAQPPPTPQPEQTEVAAEAFPVIDMTQPGNDTTVEREPWEAVSVTPTGECPDWLVYHTDMTGDWEIFRLGELADAPNADANLTRGVGTRVFDIMPARSPDNRWIVFTSNRDANWEIYISAVEETDIRRVTYNTGAVDQDPVWSPVGNEIVFESNRGENWDLYLFDLTTGEERRLTYSTGNDIGAFWSYDGTKVIYQSDRDGYWQIYELTLATMTERKLSDGIGDDHAPQYSYDDQQIAFRSYRDGDNSVVYVMNADGSDPTRISDPAGNALNHAWSPENQLIGYQANLDGDDDIYVYEMASGTTRQLTNNTVDDYAPTWICGMQEIVFTSNITDDPNIFEAPALPIDDPSIDVLADASQLTVVPAFDQYPMDTPAEENASREESVPSPVKNR